MVYVLLANGFEEIEALTSVDVIRRAGVEVKTVGIGSMTITGAHNIVVNCDVSEDDVMESKDIINLLLLPGGMPGASNLDNSATVDLLIKKTIEDGGYLAAICAAPFILGKRGLLKGKNATCYPGFEKDLEGAIVVKEGVVRDGKIITGRSMGSALDFGLCLVSALCGSETSEKVRSSIIYQ